MAVAALLQSGSRPYCNPVHPNTSTRFWSKARKMALSYWQYA
ncbi:hypothetical protein EV648_101640 [Kribbella sp. VKM Ac-2568]|nr:hypothetical protein EV648_101640 [Kribbella sp. VKM Ac-2568]